MNIKSFFLFSVGLSIMISTASHSVDVVSDVFPTNVRTASYFGTSSSSALDSNKYNSIGLRSGSSGRQLHSLFDTVTLNQVGDSITASISFITPDTTAQYSDDDMRIGLFDNLGRISESGLGQDLSASGKAPNPILNGIPGIVIELDVEPEGDYSDKRNINIRQSAPSQTGRLLGTISKDSIVNISNSSDLGYQFMPNTLYNVMISITRVTGQVSIDELNVDVRFSVTDPNSGLLRLIGNHTDTVVPTGSTDVTGRILSSDPSYSFGMMGLGVSAGAFGSVNTNNTRDNGLDIVAFTVSTNAQSSARPIYDEATQQNSNQSSDANCYQIPDGAGGTTESCF